MSNGKTVARHIWHVQTLHMRVANARKDFLHKLSTTVANNHGTVVVEALQVRNMSASSHLLVRPDRAWQ
ncbi:transposase [Acetobacter syzygii]|uniref:transposase n=1 Tax=Acetobacter syzygii TaxID=146476 RepID=UPI0039E7B9A2